MSDFDLELQGFQRAVEELDEQIRELGAVGGDRWLVGTGVEYALFRIRNQRHEP